MLRALRRASKEENPSAFILGEHFGAAPRAGVRIPLRGLPGSPMRLSALLGDARFDLATDTLTVDLGAKEALLLWGQLGAAAAEPFAE